MTPVFDEESREVVEAISLRYTTNRDKARITENEWIKNNYVKYRQKIVKWQKSNPDKMKKYSRVSVLKNYGINSQEEWDKIFISQGKVCAICGVSGPGSKTGWHIDHSHATGVVRGILCHPCNIGLGGFKDNPASLLKAIAYLEG